MVKSTSRHLFYYRELQERERQYQDEKVAEEVKL